MMGMDRAAMIDSMARMRMVPAVSVTMSGLRGLCGAQRLIGRAPPDGGPAPRRGTAIQGRDQICGGHPLPPAGAVATCAGKPPSWAAAATKLGTGALEPAALDRFGGPARRAESALRSFQG